MVKICEGAPPLVPQAGSPIVIVVLTFLDYKNEF